ncbi:sporulation histidine kinase inhibitor Sda [Paenibacillus hamazuiensis]|uniref:sporulation histidine kinase inhibitor Sda n=1 Tax=Paenibacillus hamazuiensis TaxID=2936508 RepID=UPI0023E00358|nr:sporulation histidine kinase inhibitor Sda [Paenibacillus hamazuiensis]
MLPISDDHLMDAYKKACELRLDAEFIELLKKELSLRKLMFELGPENGEARERS